MNLKSYINVYKEYLYLIRKNEYVKNRNTFRDIKIKAIDETELKDIKALRDASVEDSFDNMMALGQYCVGAYADGELVGHAVCAFPINRISKYVLHNSPYIHFCYVSPSQRGKGIYPRMLNYIIDHIFSTTKYEQIYISTTVDNNASQKGILKAGFSLVKKTIIIFVWRYYVGKMIL